MVYIWRKIKHMAERYQVSKDYLMLDVFSAFSGITCKSLFGGYGFYKDGIIFACIADGQLYFKVDDMNRSKYEAYRSEPFVYEHKSHKKTHMPYWTLPECILEDKDQLKIWINESITASLRSQKKKKYEIFR